MATLVSSLQTVLVDGVGQVTISPIIPDSEAFAREIRIVSDASPAVPLFVLRLRGGTAAAIDLVTPPLSF